MPKLLLTKTNIETKAKPHPTRDEFYWDTRTRGFGIRVTPKGLTTFIVQGRVKGSDKDIRVTIGTYEAWLLDTTTLEERHRDARRRALELRQQFEDGIDPREVKKQAEVQRKLEKAAQVTLGDVMTEYLSVRRLKPATAKWITYYVDKVFAAWKPNAIAAITRDMVKARHTELKDGGLHGDKSAPATADSAMVVLRTLFNFAMDDYRLPDGTALITENPVAVMRKRWAVNANDGDRTDRYVPVEKVGEVWNAMVAMQGLTTHPDTLSGINLAMFLLLTGARLQEGAALTWDRVHIDKEHPARCYWHLKERKAGKPIKLPLSTQLIALLEQRPRLSENPHVFASRGKTGHIMDPRTTLEKVSEVAGLHLSNHDLRRTFSETSVKACRIERFRGDLLIGHKPDPRDVGANSYLDLTDLRWLYPEIQQVADYMEGQARVAAAKASGANVVSLQTRA